LDESDLPGVASIIFRYKNLGLQLAHASLVHLAGREGTDTVFTLDRRDFGVLRLAHGRPFRLIP
jgi:predicted nucleic acid-binding protein